MDGSSLQSAEAVTAAIVAVGVVAAIWKFLLQQPLGNHYHIGITSCRVRRVVRAGQGQGQLAYTLSLTVENQSAAIQKMHGWWRRIRFPDDVPEDYDPNRSFEFNSDAEAEEYYETPSEIETYPLAAREQYVDQMIRFRDENLQGICYVEYTLKYRKWTWMNPVVKWGAWELRPRWRDWEFKSQIMIAPVEIDEFLETQRLSIGSAVPDSTLSGGSQRVTA